MNSQLQNLLDRSVDYECGLINFIAEVPTVAGEPDVQIYIAEYQDPVALFHERQHLRVGTAQASGAGLDREEAMWSTIGEALERYSAHVYRTEDIVHNTAQEVAGGSEFLNSVILFSEEDYASGRIRFHRPDNNLTRGWVQATNLRTNERSHVPASLTYMSYEAQLPHEIIDQIYSTGLASHTTMDKALLTGLCEVIERDAYTCYWLTQQHPLGIARSVVDPHLPPQFLESCRSVGFDFKVAALPTDIDVPVFMALASLPGGGVATGAACRPSVSSAITKSVVECAHTYNWCLDMKRSGVHLENKGEINSFQDHVAWYLDDQRSAAYPWRPQNIKDEYSMPDSWFRCDIADELGFVIQQVDKAGYSPLYVEITPDDIRELGFVVAKVFVPGLQPLSAGHGNVHTDTRRLKQFLSGSDFELDKEFVDSTPHAFP